MQVRISSNRPLMAFKGIGEAKAISIAAALELGRRRRGEEALERQKIKLIWDFFGLDALKIAAHYEIHLKEYIQLEKLDCEITGFEALNDHQAIAFMVVNEEAMIPVRDALKPRRGEVFME